MDFRVGGRYRFAMTGPSGEQNTPFGGEYLEILPDRKIVFDNGFELPGAGRMVMTITFDEKGGSERPKSKDEERAQTIGEGLIRLIPGIEDRK